MARRNLPQRIDHPTAVEAIRAGIGPLAPLGHTFQAWLRSRAAVKDLLVGAAARGVRLASCLGWAAPACRRGGSADQRPQLHHRLVPGPALARRYGSIGNR